MNPVIEKLRDLIKDYEELAEEAEAMSILWDIGDPEEQAENDPGLQFEKDCEVEDKFKEIINYCKEISKNN